MVVQRALTSSELDRNQYWLLPKVIVSIFESLQSWEMFYKEHLQYSPLVNKLDTFAFEAKEDGALPSGVVQTKIFVYQIIKEMRFMV